MGIYEMTQMTYKMKYSDSKDTELKNMDIDEILDFSYDYSDSDYSESD